LQKSYGLGEKVEIEDDGEKEIYEVKNIWEDISKIKPLSRKILGKIENNKTRIIVY